MSEFGDPFGPGAEESAEPVQTLGFKPMRTDERDEEYTVTLNIPHINFRGPGSLADWFIAHNPGMELIEVALTFHKDSGTELLTVPTRQVVAVSGGTTYVPTRHDSYIGCNTLLGNVNINLLPAAAMRGKHYFIKKQNSINTVTITANLAAGDLIDGAPTLVLGVASVPSAQLISRGPLEQWSIV